MARWNVLRPCNGFQLLLFFVGAINVSSIKVINTSNMIIEFTPYVSLHDGYDKYRYGITELLPLISKVASRFTKVFIRLGYRAESPEQLQSSLFLSPLAIARYNCQNTTTQTIKLFLLFDIFGCSCTDINDSIQFVTNFTDQIEHECNNTVDTLFLESEYEWDCNVTHCRHNANLLSKYNWAAWMSLTEYCEKTKDIYEFTSNISGIAIVHERNLLMKPLVSCKPYTNDPLPQNQFFHKISLTDMADGNNINMTQLVETWNILLRDKDNLYILSQAFDTYFYDNFVPNGWWYLEEDPGSNQTNEFGFKERVVEASKVDHEENPKYFEWLRTKEDISQIWTGTVYSGRISLEILTRTFCQFLIQDYEHIQDVIYYFRALNTTEPVCKSGLKIHLVVNKLSVSFLNSVLDYENENTKILILIEVDSNQESSSLKLTKYLRSLKIPYGYTIDISEILSINSESSFEENVYLDALSDLYSSRYVFTYRETKVKHGAARMFRFRKEMFKMCQNLVLNNHNNITRVEFAMLEYTKLVDFDTSPWLMQTYVKYIYHLSKWAQEQRTLLFVGYDSDGVSKRDQVLLDIEEEFISALGDEVGMKMGEFWSVGWFKYDEKHSKYLAKPEEALNLSLLHFPQQTDEKNPFVFTTSHVILLISVSVFACITMFVCGIYFMRRYHKRNTMTQTEIEYFFNGNLDPETDQNDGQNLPYDQAKYEIPQDNFKIEPDAILGSGQFGMVMRGTVLTANGDINVAIKTTNPGHIHKEKFNGLLSEIKVLAHIGRHVNIIQLIGAHTENIINGKIYIFLELCHLGSLEKFLRNMRLLMDTPVTQMNEGCLGVEMQYVNASSNGKNALDASLSNDFHRWSTEICNGMAYLARKHVVHADLATRNVLLNLKREAKISDFGLARRMFNYTSYVKTHAAPMPWKWMAPEALQHMCFNEKTDVWAYGITLWEIYSLGNIPYAGLSWDADVVGMLEMGLKPSKPEFDEKNKYKMMKRCWEVIPEKRPSFSEILLLLTSDNLEDREN